MFGITLEEQTLLFLQACTLGVSIGLLYDMFKVTAILLKARMFLRSLFDVLFSAVSVIMVFLFIITMADGIVRIYIPTGIVLGLILYYTSASVCVIKGIQKIIFGIKFALQAFFKPIKNFVNYFTALIGRFIKNNFIFLKSYFAKK